MNDLKLLENRSIYIETKNLIESAKVEILLVSPFINKKLLVNLLKSVNANVSVTLVTRFRIMDLLAKMNDLSIFDYFKEQENMHLHLLHSLHAKYYRGDSNVILGSGNLTYKGLSPGGRGNAEVMLKLNNSIQGVQEFEANLISQSTVPNEQLIDDLRSQLLELEATKKENAVLIELAKENLLSETSTWVPQCQMPNCLFEVYCGRVSEIDIEVVSEAKADLAYLALPGGLDQINFKINVRIALQQTKVINLILSELNLHHTIDISTCREIVVATFKGDLLTDIDQIWQTYVRWLDIFFDGFTRH